MITPIYIKLWHVEPFSTGIKMKSKDQHVNLYQAIKEHFKEAPIKQLIEVTEANICLACC